MKTKVILFLVILGLSISTLFLYQKQPQPQKIETKDDANEQVRKLADSTVLALKNKDFNRLAEIMHLRKGLHFSPYSYVNKQEISLSKIDIEKGFENPKVYEWGVYDGIGNPILLTFEKYYEEFIYDADFVNSKEVSINKKAQRGNTIDNAMEYYPEGIVVEYYLSGTNPEYGGMDWAALRLVFEKEEGEWKLVGIIHDEWTI